MRALRIVLLGFLLRIVYAGYCTQSYSCTKVCRTSTKYYAACGWWGWGRCQRYRNFYKQCAGTCNKRICCTGYTGNSCIYPLCYGSTSCPNGGTCTTPNRCSCPRGFSLPRCHDINECTSTAHGCEHTCVNTHGSYQCTCRPGYTLASDLKSCLDVNECHTKNGGCDQVCNNMAGSYTCGCRNGYELNGQKCSDLDECSLGISGCAHQCKNTEGSYICSCNSGYELAIDGVNCEDIDECVDGTSNCEIVCNNTPGSYTCYCGSGYVIGDDGSCEDVDECSNENGDCDQLCVNEPGFHRCECNSGFRMLELNSNSSACLDIDECSEAIAKCSHICSNSNGSYECSCNTGYQLDTNGYKCLDKNDCGSIVCQNGGSCVDKLDFYTCVCNGGFHGQQCETDINECDLANGGCQDICINSAGSYKCNCSDGVKLLENGLSCQGNKNDKTVFERFEINRQLLPTPCFTVMLVQCTDGNDVDIFLSSTSEWFRFVEDTDVLYTLGIVFVNVNDYSIPLALQGVELALKDKSFVINYSVQKLPEQGDVIDNELTDDKCIPFEFSKADMYDFISRDSFMKSFLRSLFPVLPNWLRFEKSETEILSVQDVKSELIYGKNLDEVQWCSGAPVLPEHLYNVFRFDSGFTLSVMGSKVTLPKLLSYRKFCFIVDLCHSYGGTLFLMIPEESRNLLLELFIFETLKEEQNFQMFPRGIGISFTDGIDAANSHAVSHQLWNGDHMFTPLLLPKFNFWIGGKMTKEDEMLTVNGDADIFFDVPSVQTMITSLYREEWTGLIDFQQSIKWTILKFKLFEKEYSVSLPLLTSENAYISIGGSNRQWCGDVSNPQGFFFSMMIEVNPFNGIPFLEDFVISLTSRLHIFVISDPQDDSNKEISLVDTANDILELEKLMDNTVSILDKTIANFEQSLSNSVRAIVNEVKNSARTIRNKIKTNLHHFLSGNIDVIINELEIMRQSVLQMRYAVNIFVDKIEFIVDEAVSNLTNLFENHIDAIENQIDTFSSGITKSIITSLGQISGFGLKFKADFKIFGLKLIGIDIEAVYSTGNLFRCSRFEKIKKLLEGESALRYIGRFSNERKLGYFLYLNRGLGFGAAFAVNSKNVIINFQAFVSMLGVKATGDLFITINSINFYLEGNVWGIFLAQIDVTAEVGKEWDQLTFNLRGRFVAKARKKRQFNTRSSLRNKNILHFPFRKSRHGRQIQTVSTSFQDSYLDALKTAIRYVSDDAQKRLTQVQKALKFAKNGLTKAQNWFEEKQIEVREANTVFDSAVKELDRKTKIIEDAKGPLKQALKSLENAQIDVDNLCKIKNCNGICIPGITCRICFKWFIPYPCCKLTGCMFRIPNIPCIIANLACRIIRAAAYVILEIAKVFVRGAMLAFDIAKAAVTVAQFVVDKSRVVLTVAEGILELATIGLEVAKGILEAAKLALEAVKFVIGAAAKVLEFVIAYGIQSIIDVRNCGFDIELSTKDLPVFEVSCEVNAFRLGWTTVRLKINFKNILQSIWQAGTAAIKAIIKTFGGIFSGRKRRDLEFDASSRIHVFLRKIRESDKSNSTRKYLNESIDISKTITGFRDTEDNEFDNRIELFREKCMIIIVIQEFMQDAFSLLQDIVNESKLYIKEVDSVKRQLAEYNTTSTSTTNFTAESVGISSEYAAKDYNMTKGHLDKAINDTKAAFDEDPLLAELKSAANIAVETVDSEKKSVESVDYQSAWFAAMKNMTKDYFNESDCDGFQDCMFHSISSLYTLYESEDLPNVSLIQESILDLESILIETFQNESSSIMDTSLAMEYILKKINYLVSVNLFCSEPPMFLTDLQNQTALTGSTVNFHCNVSGNPEPWYSWRMNGTILYGEKLSILTISSVSSDDVFDKYTCVAGNVVTHITSNGAYIIITPRDEDECKTDSSICQHICTNTFGSYICSCKDGFLLERDGTTCSEKGNASISANYMTYVLPVAAVVFVLIVFLLVVCCLRICRSNHLQLDRKKSSACKVTNVSDPPLSTGKDLIWNFRRNVYSASSTADSAAGGQVCSGLKKNENDVNSGF